MPKHPGLLFELARVKRRGVSGLSADELRKVAREQWPKLAADEIEQAVEQAIEWRARTQRRLDPTTTDVQDPRTKETTMPTKDAVKGFIAALIDDDPDIGYVEINDEVNKRFEDTEYSRSQTSAIARAILDERKDNASTNGAKPEPPKAPRTEDAEPAHDESPATDSAGETVEGPGTTVMTAADIDPFDHIPRSASPGRYSERAMVERRFSAGERTDRVQVDVNPDTRSARLFVDISDLPAAAAYRIAADVQRSLAGVEA